MSQSSVQRLLLPLSCFAGGVVATSVYLRSKHHQQRRETSPPVSIPAKCKSYDGPVDVFEAVGNTPLLELKSLSELTGCKIYAKAEFMNPSGSVKDRAAKYLILDAEQQGLLKKGDTIIEATSGNTGVSLAQLAAARGYKTVFTMPAKTAQEKIDLMKVMGAQVIVQPSASVLDTENHFYHVAQRLAKITEGAVCPNQVRRIGLGSHSLFLSVSWNFVLTCLSLSVSLSRSSRTRPI